MRKDGWFSKKFKLYEYKGKVVKAVNKPEAADMFGISRAKNLVIIKKLKGK